MKERLLIALLPLLLLSPRTCQASIVGNVWNSLTAWLYLPALEVYSHDGPACLDAEGNPVDWWMAVKLPGGNDLAYLDSRAAAELGEEARFRYMSAEGSALNRTLLQLYADEGARSAGTRLGAAGHIMYSDEPPLVEGLGDEESFNFAFTQGKGVMGYGEDRGFWLVHSVPSFPAAPRKAAYAGVPRREAGNTHTLLCMSAATRQLSAASATLRANSYYVYSEAAPEQARGGLSDAQREAFPDLVGSEPDEDISKTGSSVRATEFETLEGERFVVFANDGQRPGVRVMRDIVQSYFGTGMLYSNPPPDQGEEPCEGDDSAFPSLRAREYYMEDGDAAWSAAEDSSTWAISLGGQSRCPETAEEADMVASQQLLHGKASVDAAGELVQQNVEDAAESNKQPDQAQPMWSQTMTRPVTSVSRRRLLTSQPWPGQQGPGVLRVWLGDLAAWTKGWWRAFGGLAGPEDTGDDTSFLPAVPLFTPPDASFPSAAADILQERTAAALEAAAADASQEEKALEAMAWQESGSEAPRLPQEEGPVNGEKIASSEWQVDGVAFSDEADAEEEAFLALQELGQPDQEGCKGGSCTATAALAEHVAALEERLQRLEDFVVEADSELDYDGEYGEHWDYTEYEEDVSEYENDSDGYEDDAAQELMWGCEQSAAQRSVACVHDAGRSLQSADLPGGAVCFAGNAAVWAALRDLVQWAELATVC